MKHLVTAAILMAAGHLYAQSQALYECIYNYQITPKELAATDIKTTDIKTTDIKTNNRETTDCILLIGEDRSKFIDYAAFRLDSINALPDAPKEVKENILTEWQKGDQYFEQTLLTDLSSGVLTVYSDLSPDRFRYNQQLPLIEWQLSDDSDTETICGYTCHKATAEYGGRQWTVWYADEIPVPFGPWKLSGLPGLVLKGIDSDGLHDFEAISFRTAANDTAGDPLAEPKNGTAVDPLAEPKIPNVNTIKIEKFIERKNSYDRDPLGSVNRESITEMTVMPNKSLLINGVRMRQHKKGYQPLEYSPTELKKHQK